MTEATISRRIEQFSVWTATDTEETPQIPSVRAERWTIGDLDTVATAAAEGDRRSTETLLRLVQPLIVRYCRAQLGRQESSFSCADDVAQEACLAIFAMLPHYRGQDLPFLAVAHSIAVQKVTDAFRATAHDRIQPVATTPPVPESAAGPEERAMGDVTAGRIAALRQVLSAKQWEILMLRVVVGLSAKETADAVGSTPGAVRVVQHKALARLRLTASRWNPL